MPAHPAEVEAQDFEVWEENWESFCWFIRLGRRWIFNQNDGSRICLDDAAIQAQFEIFGIKRKKRAAIMADLLEMERAALEAFPPPATHS
ncbi:MAG: DUF1799 domain-containing protein [Gallionella sp.]|nr:DUF1799 domain-containing protein [Gallionella sp.]MDD5611881.1 DUF1799 domain-containing protein [Gallionella sp.]